MQGSDMLTPGREINLSGPQISCRQRRQALPVSHPWNPGCACLVSLSFRQNPGYLPDIFLPVPFFFSYEEPQK